MFGIRLLCCIFSIIGSALTASPPPTNRGFMQSKLQPFVDSLALPPPQAQSLSNKLDQDSNLAAFLSGKDYQSSLLLAVACLSIRASLGAESVDTIPINQTETEANWLAHLSLTYHCILNMWTQVARLLAFPNMCRSPRISARCIQSAQEYQILQVQICRPQWRAFS